MASLYKRGDVWWIRYKKDGQWMGASTGFRVSNFGETQLARRLCRTRTQEEQIASRDCGDSRWECWVLKWIDLKWGSKKATQDIYKRNWAWLAKWLDETGLDRPSRISRDHCHAYVAWRKSTGAGRNTAIHELKLLAQVLGEALQRGYIDTNPAQRLGLPRETPEEKHPWTDHQIQVVGDYLEKNEFGSWKHVTFLLGLYQAARLRQCGVPNHMVDIPKGIIRYPGDVVKGGNGFSQPIDVRLIPVLGKIIAYRKAQGFDTLCCIPQFASIDWRRFLDSLGFNNIMHHGLRVTWITRACLARVPEAQAMRFAHHSSFEVHRIYQKLSASDLAAVPAAVPFPSLGTADAGNTSPAAISCSVL